MKSSWLNVNILLAPNAFKGSLDAPAVCRILQEELSSRNCSVTAMPLGDGGDGTASILASYWKAGRQQTYAHDALNRMHPVSYFRKDSIALLGLADICGLKFLQPSEYDVLNAQTTGVGEIIHHAVNTGARHIFLCAGGSASVDGGLGALQAMGLHTCRTSAKYNNLLLDLQSIDIVQLQDNFKDIHFTLLCDVNTSAGGSQGAVSVFAPQKGANPAQVRLLTNAMNSWLSILQKTTHQDMAFVKHGGAAGGIAASFAALLNARLVSGADFCLQEAGFESQLAAADLVITGEGHLDSQSLLGKIPGTVAAHCQQKGIKVIAIAGDADPIPVTFPKVYSLTDYAGSKEASMRDPERYLRIVAQDIKANLLKLL